METQDIRYVFRKRNVEAKKIDKLQSQLHMIDAATETKNKHVFLADDKEETKDFDVAKRLDTHSELLGRRRNRSKLFKLREMKLPDVDERMLAKIEQQKHMAYKELHKRIDRERELTITQQKIEAKRALQDKEVPKPKKIKSGTADAPPIYQWKFQRKR